MKNNKKIKLISEYCLGCGICEAGGMTKLCRNDKGYLQYNGNDSDTFLDFASEVCPVLGKHTKSLSTDSVWGYCEDSKIHLGAAADTTVRKESSSGGSISALCIYLLEKGFVDAILHTCVSDEDPTKTQFCISTSKEEIISRCGSRYTISEPLFHLLSRIEVGKKYAFVGKPCDVAILKRYMNINEGLKDSVKYTLGFFCAGLPSKNANERLLDEIGIIDTCKSLRYRGNGWPGLVEAVDINNQTFTMEYEHAWGAILGRDINKFCRFCMDGIAECADISFGDGWYLNSEGRPDFSESDGRNVIISRTEIGNKLLQGAIESGYILDLGTESEEYIRKIQKYQFTRKTTMKAKCLAFSMLGRRHPIIDKKLLSANSEKANPADKIRIWGGSIKRILKKRM